MMLSGMQQHIHIHGTHPYDIIQTSIGTCTYIRTYGTSHNGLDDDRFTRVTEDLQMQKHLVPCRLHRLHAQGLVDDERGQCSPQVCLRHRSVVDRLWFGSCRPKLRLAIWLKSSHINVRYWDILWDRRSAWDCWPKLGRLTICLRLNHDWSWGYSSYRIWIPDHESMCTVNQVHHCWRLGYDGDFRNVSRMHEAMF